jgi:signal transduction histidine kinase
MKRPGFTGRLVATLALLLLGYGLLAGLAFQREAERREALALQGVSRGLAGHIVGHWPQITAATPDAAERGARQAVLQMLMAVNPGVQAYLLDADGGVAEYLGEPGMVREPRVDLEPVRAFIAGAPLPLRGTDPMGSGQPRLFSAAMFPPRAGDARPPGYLYIVLDGAARQRATDGTPPWRTAAAVAALGLALALAAGVFVVRRIARPLRRLAARMQAYRLPALPGQGDSTALPAGDELRVLDAAFAGMTARIEAQAGREREQTAAHRETMAALAHDLRTPLTALHGHLEALPAAGAAAPKLLQAALTQSDKVRRLSQQLFELAALQSAQDLAQRERFRLDELVADSVGKFQLAGYGAVPVLLDERAPGVIEVEGDLQLVERALTNLIDNARRHGGGPAPVRVHLQAGGGQAQVVVEDRGPGMPEALHRRLLAGQPLRDAPLARSSAGGIGGLGLAIAQRIAVLHGGSLRPLPAPEGGTRLCLALPLARLAG